MKLNHTQLAVLLSMALAAGVATAAPAGTIYERQSEEGSVELSNLTTAEDAQVVVEGSTSDTTTETRAVPTRPRKASSAADGSEAEASDGSSVPADSVGRSVADAERVQPTPSSGGGANGWGGAMPSMLNIGGTGSSAVAAVAEPAAGAGGGASTIPGTGTGSTVPSGPGTAHPSILDNPTALEARAQQYRELMLHEPLQANGLPANPATVRRYLATTRSGFQGR